MPDAGVVWYPVGGQVQQLARRPARALPRRRQSELPCELLCRRCSAGSLLGSATSELRFAQFPGFCRVADVTVPSSLYWGWLTAAEALAPYASPPKAGWILTIPLVAAAVLRLLMEWQLRRTLAEIFQHAPSGTVIVIRKRGLGGSMQVQVGSRPVPCSRPGPPELG